MPLEILTPYPMSFIPCPFISWRGGTIPCHTSSVLINHLVGRNSDSTERERRENTFPLSLFLGTYFE